MMPPPAYSEARFRARFHAQVEYDIPRVQSTLVTLRCRVRHVFRGGDLNVGDVIRLRVRVYAELRQVTEGTGPWIMRDALLKGRYGEVFLNGRPPEITIAASQFRL